MNLPNGLVERPRPEGVELHNFISQKEREINAEGNFLVSW